jgi:hypothetical protein
MPKDNSVRLEKSSAKKSMRVMSYLQGIPRASGIFYIFEVLSIRCSEMLPVFLSRRMSNYCLSKIRAYRSEILSSCQPYVDQGTRLVKVFFVKQLSELQTMHARSGTLE